MDTRLIKILDEMVEEERKRKKPKARGKINRIIRTKNNNIMLILEDDRRLLVNKKSSLIGIAEKIIEGDEVYAEGEKGINIIFCDELRLISRKSNEAQTKL